jgi:hypothetical protein
MTEHEDSTYLVTADSAPAGPIAPCSLVEDVTVVGRIGVEGKRAGHPGWRNWDLERSPRLAAILGTPVFVAFGECVCLLLTRIARESVYMVYIYMLCDLYAQCGYQRDAQKPYMHLPLECQIRDPTSCPRRWRCKRFLGQHHDKRASAYIIGA